MRSSSQSRPVINFHWPIVHSRFNDIKYYVFWTGYFCTPAQSLNTPRWVITRVLPGTERGTFVMIVGALVTWAIYTQGQLLSWSSCHAKFVAIAAGHQLPLTHRALTVPRYQIWHVWNRLFLYSSSKPEHPPVGDHSCTTGNRTRNLCYDCWSLSHLGYLCPGTTPVMIKLDHNRSCPWV